MALPEFELGEFGVQGLVLPSFVFGEDAPAGLALPLFLFGEYHNDIGTSVIVFGSSADVFKNTFVSGTSAVVLLDQALVHWVANVDVSANLVINGIVAGARHTFVENIEALVLTAEALGQRVYFGVGQNDFELVTAVEVTRKIDAKVINSLVITTDALANAEYFLNAESVLKIITGVEFVNAYRDGWAYNLNNGAPSFYEDFKFNSFAKVGNDYYGLNDTGIHLLGANDDDGDQIDALITTGKSDYGDEFTKKIPIIYAGARSEKPLQLTARVDEQPDYTYQFQDAPSKLSRCRVKLGRGLEGSYWQIEIANKDGSDFEIDSLDIPPISNSRKI